MARVRGLTAILVVLLVGAGPACGSSAAQSVGLHVAGNQLFDGMTPVRLLGVNRSSTEFRCLSDPGQFIEGPSDQTGVDAMLSWKINTVRVALSESCWLGTNGVRGAGSAYRQAIVAYVSLLRANNLFVILDLHAIPTDRRPNEAILPMADAAHAPAYWRSLASTFRNTPGTVFDLYNEPHDISWSCWLRGCRVRAGKSSDGARYGAYRAVGMQQLVNIVRGTGAMNPIMLGGLAYAGDISGWLAHEPTDPAGQLIASEHNYGGLSPCDDGCRQAILSVAAKAPVVTGELGEDDCQHGYIDDYMNWADQNGISYLGWAWFTSPDPKDCGAYPLLITGYDGTPTGMGIGLRDHLRALAGG